jgi:hypothetical protein
MKKIFSIPLLCFLFLIPQQTYSWGFFAHQLINRLAIFTLPPEMIGFYKYHIRYITENAVNPDRRRYAVEGEAPRHYIDIDVYGDSAIYKLPRTWKMAVEKYTEDTLQAYGIVPWHVYKMKFNLTEAFKAKDKKKILLLSADIGHYIGDANVPLHTTENYNGQKTGQYGIHGFWESRLPELFSDSYDFFFDRKAEYLERPLSKAWEAVTNAHLALDSVLLFEKELTESMGEGEKFSYEIRNNINTRVYSKDFSTNYHKKLNGQVERRMQSAIQMVGDFWYTAWVDAGQPNLDSLLRQEFSAQDLKELEPENGGVNPDIKTRQHETSSLQFFKDLFYQNRNTAENCCCEFRH